MFEYGAWCSIDRRSFGAPIQVRVILWTEFHVDSGWFESRSHPAPGANHPGHPPSEQPTALLELLRTMLSVCLFAGAMICIMFGTVEMKRYSALATH